MRTILSIVFSLTVCTVCWASEEKINVAAPSALPGVISEMRSPGFWAARHPSPDEQVLGEKGIAGLNRRIMAEGLTENIARSPRVLPGVKVRGELAAFIDGLKKKVLYGEDGQPVNAERIARFAREVDAVSEKVEVLYGFIVKPTDLRLLPTAEHFYAEPGDVDFDEVQNSGLDIGVPVIVLAHSRDRQWLYVHDAISSGWVVSSSVARASFDIFNQELKAIRPVTIISARADMFLDKEMTEYVTSVRMGAVFSYKSLSGAFWEVRIPSADLGGDVKFVSAYIPRKDAVDGTLPYTPRVIYEQAFKLLDAPYGWGDMNGGQDCSRLLQMVFASVGIQLPRNSAEQGKVGLMMPGFNEKLSVGEKATTVSAKGLPAATILRLKGHIMLYLGPYKDKPYAIHSTWAYREPMPDGSQRARVIGRVAVTSLDLGAGSAKGSLLERTVSARVLK